MGEAPEAVALYLVWSDNNSKGANNHTTTVRGKQHGGLCDPMLFLRRSVSS
jgi:hypothetical protein